MIKILKINMLIFNDLMGKNYNIFALASGLMSFLVDQFSEESLGSISAVLIFTLTGIFSILKARESWLKDKNHRIHYEKMQDLEFKIKQKEL